MSINQRFPFNHSNTLDTMKESHMLKVIESKNNTQIISIEDPPRIFFLMAKNNIFHIFHDSLKLSCILSYSSSALRL